MFLKTVVLFLEILRKPFNNPLLLGIFHVSKLPKTTINGLRDDLNTHLEF